MDKKQCLTEGAKWDRLLVAPMIISLIALNVCPFLQTLVLSFSTTHPFGYYKASEVENYVQVFGSRGFRRATWGSVYFRVLTVPLGIFLSLLTTVLFNVKIQVEAVLRAIYPLPMVVVSAVITMVWRQIFNAEYGTISQVIGSRINWLTDPKLVLPACAMVVVWSMVGYDAVPLLPGIQNVSKSYYEAASLDGVSKIEQLFKIMLPIVSPTLSVVLIMRLMASLKIYDLIYVVVDQTNSALTSARSLMYLFYHESLVAGNRGYASAIVVWTVLLIGTMTVLQFWGQKK